MPYSRMPTSPLLSDTAELRLDHLGTSIDYHCGRRCPFHRVLPCLPAPFDACAQPLCSLFGRLALERHESSTALAQSPVFLLVADLLAPHLYRTLASNGGPLCPTYHTAQRSLATHGSGFGRGSRRPLGSPVGNGRQRGHATAPDSAVHRGRQAHATRSGGR